MQCETRSGMIYAFKRDGACTDENMTGKGLEEQKCLSVREEEMRGEGEANEEGRLGSEGM